MFTRTTLLVAFSIPALVRFAPADEPSQKFKANLMYVDYPVQIMADAGGVVAPVDWDPRVHLDNPFKARVAPRVKCSSSTLMNPVYDVSEWLRSNGVSMPKGSEALFSPRAKLLYLNSTEDDLNVAETFAGWPYGDSLYTMDLRASLKEGGHVETLFEAKAVPVSLPGRPMEFTVTGKKKLHLALAPYFVPDGHTVETELEAEVSVAGKSLKVLSIWKTAVAESAETTLGKVGNATMTLRMKTRVETEYWGPGVLATKAGKAEAIKEIQEAREHDRAH